MTWLAAEILFGRRRPMRGDTVVVREHEFPSLEEAARFLRRMPRGVMLDVPQGNFASTIAPTRRPNHA